MACGSFSHNAVEPSMSVTRKVTIPVGKEGSDKSQCRERMETVARVWPKASGIRLLDQCLFRPGARSAAWRQRIQLQRVTPLDARRSKHAISCRPKSPAHRCRTPNEEFLC